MAAASESLHLKIVQAYREGCERTVVSIPEHWEDLMQLLLEALEVYKH